VVQKPSQNEIFWFKKFPKIYFYSRVFLIQYKIVLKSIGIIFLVQMSPKIHVFQVQNLLKAGFTGPITFQREIIFYKYKTSSKALLKPFQKSSVFFIQELFQKFAFLTLKPVQKRAFLVNCNGPLVIER
jgi:hypothetical protein